MQGTVLNSYSVSCLLHFREEFFCYLSLDMIYIHSVLLSKVYKLLVLTAFYSTFFMADFDSLSSCINDVIYREINFFWDFWCWLTWLIFSAELEETILALLRNRKDLRMELFTWNRLKFQFLLPLCWRFLNMPAPWPRSY